MAAATLSGAGVPRKLFDTRSALGYGFYAASADGQRFLIAERPETESPIPLTIVTNWLSGTKR